MLQDDYAGGKQAEGALAGAGADEELRIRMPYSRFRADQKNYGPRPW